MAVDEPDVARVHPSGRPDVAITSLRRLHLPDAPSVEEIKRAPTFITMDIRLRGLCHPKAYATWDLWMTRTMLVSFLLLDPSNIADVTAQYLEWARTAGDRARDSEITIDRAMTVESWVRKAQSGMQTDSKFLLRKV